MMKKIKLSPAYFDQKNLQLFIVFDSSLLG